MRDDLEVEERANAWLEREHPDEYASIEAKTAQVAAQVAEGALDEDEAVERLIADRLTQREARILRLAYGRARVMLRTEQRCAEEAALPAWRRRLRAFQEALSSLAWRWPRLRCLLGQHVWAPVGELNILGEMESTGEEICDTCLKSRKHTPR